MQKLFNVVISIAVLVVLGLYFVPAGQPTGATSYPAYEALQKWFGGGIAVGTAPTSIKGINWSNCQLIASTYTVAASTTVAMDCAQTGATPNDAVLVQFGTSTIPVAGSWRIVGASPSSTPGYDTLQVRNDTGASAVIPSQLASSTSVLNIR
jgi:hypothetical protein